MDALAQNLKFAARQLRRNPGFTVTVILTLALSVGANTAIFSIVNVLMLKSLPYPHPERMGTIYTRVSGSTASDERHNLNGEQWELLRDNVPSLISAVSSRGTSGVNLRAGSRVQYLHGGRISAHYLDVLGVLSSGLYEGAPLMSEQAMYIPAAQVNAQYLSLVHVWFQPDWVVRTAGPFEGLTAQMQRSLASADPGLL
jgi:hypothetical protein